MPKTDYTDERPRCLRTECFANYGDRCSCLTDNDFGRRECPFFKTREQRAKEEIELHERKQQAARRLFRMDNILGTHR